MLKRYGKSVYKKLAILAKEANLVSKNLDNESAANVFINWINSLNAKFNIPYFIKEINEVDLDQLATNASKEANPLYPVPLLLSKNELKECLEIISDRKNSSNN